MKKLTLLLVLSGILASNLFAQVTKTWDGSSGDWSDGSKWSPVGAPTAFDDVVISSGSVTLDISPTVANRTLNGTVTGNFNLVIAGNLTQAIGNMNNVGNTLVGGTFLWTGGQIGTGTGGTVSIAGLSTINGTSCRVAGKTLVLNGRRFAALTSASAVMELFKTQSGKLFYHKAPGLCHFGEWRFGQI